MDSGTYTFTIDIPPNFQRDMLAGRRPAIQLNVDATRMSGRFSATVIFRILLRGGEYFSG